MERDCKPIPDVQALAYHGTPETPDIKIFVSHRIDLDSETIDNPLYIPVRCGAVFDRREGIRMLGDDTGDNISDKRLSFCELTVQYWAWKNVQADYYGLCHYRRYLSFSEQRYPADAQAIVREGVLNAASAEKHNLLDPERMVQRLRPLDALFQEEFDVRRWPNPDSRRNVDRLWRQMSDLIEGNSLDLLLQTLGEQYPDYTETAQAYLHRRYFRGFNCFILKKELFFHLCEFEFSILFHIEKKLDTARYSALRHRTLAYLAEILESIWIQKNIIGRKDRRWETTQLVLFEKTQAQPPIAPACGSGNVPVVLVSSDSYAPYAAVCLQSILYHASREHHYDIIVLTRDMSPANRQRLSGMCAGRPNVSLRFCDPEPLLYPCEGRLPVSPGADWTSLCRIALPYLFPDYDKMLCLDCDLVLETDIARLFETELGESLLAAVRDVAVQGLMEGADEYLTGRHDGLLPDSADYVNTGVTVWNLSALRQRYSLSDILQIAMQKPYRKPQQDILNILAAGRCRLLDERWNVFTQGSEAVRTAITFAPRDCQRRYAEARKEPFLVHWAGSVKPWQKPDDDMAERFWFYARMSPVYEVILHRMTTQADQPDSSRSGIRRLADAFLPKGTLRRELLKKLLPRGSRRWFFLKGIYQRMGGR